MGSAHSGSSSGSGSGSGSGRENGGKSVPVVVFKESWEGKEERIKAQSKFGDCKGYALRPILIKTNDDLRQEQMASQIISQCAHILSAAKIPVWLYPYEIYALSDSCGVIEAVPDTISLDSLKRNDDQFVNLKDFFVRFYGDEKSEAFSGARANFVESLAAYSIVTFLLQVKDRHNGNILLGKDGHIVHIDFGFLFLSSPGKGIGFESAPFKLTREMVELLGGPNSRFFIKYRELCVRTFMELRRHQHRLVMLVEMLISGNEDLPCFCGKANIAVKLFKERFKLHLNDNACRAYINGLIDASVDSWTTRWYDRYQRCCVGIM